MLAGLLDVLAPPRCAGCAGAARVLCVRCFDDIASHAQIVRRDVPGVGSVTALGPYDGVLRRAILAMKYSNAAAVSTALGSLLARCVRFRGVLVPVPLHVTRLRKRGHNQAEILARGLMRRLRSNGERVSVQTRAVARARATAPQSGLDHDQRRVNVSAAFCPGPAADAVRGERVMLVDDVLTTGATLQACARVLLHCGAASVDACCAAIRL